MLACTHVGRRLSSQPSNQYPRAPIGRGPSWACVHRAAGVWDGASASRVNPSQAHSPLRIHGSRVQYPGEGDGVVVAVARSDSSTALYPPPTHCFVTCSVSNDSIVEILPLPGPISPIPNPRTLRLITRIPRTKPTEA